MENDVKDISSYLKAEICKLKPDGDDFIVIRYDKEEMTVAQMSQIHNSMIQSFQRGVITLPFDVSIQTMTKDELVDLANGLQHLIAELIDENTDN